MSISQYLFLFFIYKNLFRLNWKLFVVKTGLRKPCWIPEVGSSVLFSCNRFLAKKAFEKKCEEIWESVVFTVEADVLVCKLDPVFNVSVLRFRYQAVQ